MISSIKVNKEFFGDFSLIDLRLTNIFFIGVILYSIGYTLPFTGLINYQLANGIQLIAIMFFLPTAILLIDLKVRNVYLRVLIVLYLLYLTTVIYRGFLVEYDFIKFLLFDGWYGIFIYLVPIVCLFPKKISFVKKLFDAINIFSVIFLLVVLASIPMLLARGVQTSFLSFELLSRTLGITSGLILFTYPYHNKKIIVLAIIVLSVILLFATYHARRSLMFYSIIIFLLSGYTYLINGKSRLFATVVFLMIFSSFYILGTEVLNKSSLFSYVLERGAEDTRSNVEIRFYEDMETLDWIFGRGINGQYYCPGIVWDGEVSIYRDVIETDFLQVILKGGIISLSFLFMIFLPAVFLGLFFSNNLFTKAGAIWILIGIINMYPAQVNTFTLNYMTMWLFVGFIYNSKFRKLSNNQIFTQLNKKKIEVL